MWLINLHVPVMYIFQIFAINVPADVITPGGARLSIYTVLTFQRDVFPGKFLF